MGVKNIKYGGIWRFKMSISQIISYSFVHREEPEGGYTVTVPPIAGCVMYGK